MPKKYTLYSTLLRNRTKSWQWHKTSSPMMIQNVLLHYFFNFRACLLNAALCFLVISTSSWPQLSSSSNSSRRNSEWRTWKANRKSSLFWSQPKFVSLELVRCHMHHRSVTYDNTSSYNIRAKVFSKENQMSWHIWYVCM